MSELTPDNILHQIPEEKILKRMYSLGQTYKLLRKKWKGLSLDNDILRHSVESYFCDLQRMKAFHDIQFADPHKRAGFTIKWLVKLRPIQIISNYRVTKASLLANECYAVFAGINHLSIDVDDIPKNFLRNFLYTLHYRYVDGEILSSMMFLLEDSSSQRKRFKN